MEFIRMVESLLQGVQTNELTPEDFIERLNELHENEKRKE